jgi:hypothetical protein
MIQVVISNLSQKRQTDDVKTSGEGDEDIDQAKRRNPFAKKTNVETKIINEFRTVHSKEIFSSTDSGFYSQTPVEVSSSQLSICSIDDDQVWLFRKIYYMYTYFRPLYLLTRVYSYSFKMVKPTAFLFSSNHFKANLSLFTSG